MYWSLVGYHDVKSRKGIYFFQKFKEKKKKENFECLRQGKYSNEVESGKSKPSKGCKR